MHDDAAFIFSWAVFINILVLKCGMYFRAAFNEINVVLVGKAWVNYAA